MKQKIALLADVHGNQTALEAVLADCEAEHVTDYWFLGDLVLPGPGGEEIFALLDDVDTSAWVRGNWDDCFLETLDHKINLDDHSDVYVGILSKYLFGHLSHERIELLRHLPLHTTKQVNGLTVGLSHNLPTRNYGPTLLPNAPQGNFDQLFVHPSIDIAVCGHTHHQLLRYSSQGKIVINPGTIGQAFSVHEKIRKDRRAQYAILEIDELGMTNVQFKKVAFDIDLELKRAQERHLPYYDLYEEMLRTGITHTHDIPVLKAINIQENYVTELKTFLTSILTQGSLFL